MILSSEYDDSFSMVFFGGGEWLVPGWLSARQTPYLPFVLLLQSLLSGCFKELITDAYKELAAKQPSSRHPKVIPVSPSD